MQRRTHKIEHVFVKIFNVIKISLCYTFFRNINVTHFPREISLTQIADLLFFCFSRLVKCLSVGNFDWPLREIVIRAVSLSITYCSEKIINLTSDGVWNQLYVARPNLQALACLAVTFSYEVWNLRYEQWSWFFRPLKVSEFLSRRGTLSISSNATVKLFVSVAYEDLSVKKFRNLCYKLVITMKVMSTVVPAKGHEY